MKRSKKAVILFSGGLDSTTALYYALSKSYKCHCLIIDYGQRHDKEVKTAVKIAKLAGSGFDILKLSFPWSKSALTDKNSKLPGKLPAPKTVPSTYVPGRNTLFLSYALSCAEAKKAETIYIGVNSLDFSNYPDCTPKFIKSYNALLRSLGLKITVKAPLLYMSKAKIIKLGTGLKVPYGLTWSCYSGLKDPCGKCDSCRLRARGFEEAGLADPALNGR